jgi:adenine-specific DNA glycosylase
MEILSITALILSVIAGVGAFVKEAHLQKCKACCIESDCREPKSRSPSNTPIETQPKREIEENNITSV